MPLHTLFKSVKSLTCFIADIYHAQRGIRSFTRRLDANDLRDFLQINTSADQYTTIHCTQETYDCEFNNFWPKSKCVTIYHVYAVCSANTPEDIKERFKVEMRLPPCLPHSVSAAIQSRTCIDAYLAYICANRLSS